MPAPLAVKQGNNPGRRSQVRALKDKRKSYPGGALGSEQGSSDLQRRLCAPGAAAAARPCWEALSLRRQAGRRRPAPLPDSRRHRGTETNVDTGLAVGNPGSGRCPLSHFPRALRSSLPQPAAPGAGDGDALPARDGARPLRAPGKAAAPGAPPAPRASPALPAEDEEQEFFI